MSKQNNALYFKNSSPSLFTLFAYKTAARFRAWPKKDHFSAIQFSSEGSQFDEVDFELFQECNDFSERLKSHPRKRSS